MRTQAEVGRIVRGLSPQERVPIFAALLVSEAGLGSDDLVVVGGSAVEIYTRAKYASDDIDLVGDQAKLTPILSRWGFTHASRSMWSHPEWRFTIDLVKGSLEAYTGSLERTRTISTPYGLVRVEAPEDSLVRRLIQARHWKRESEFEWALAVAAENKGSIDWAYAERIAKLDMVADLLAEIRKRVER